MKGQVIGKSMNHGYAGGYSRQPDMVIDSHPLGGDSAVTFGAPLVYSSDGKVVPFGATGTASEFVGIASREIKSAVNFLDQNTGQYQVGEAVSVFKRGCINVVCNVGTPKLGGKVYVRTGVNTSFPLGVVGGFEAAEDAGNTIELTNCEWCGEKDVNNVAELRIKTMNRA